MNENDIVIFPLPLRVARTETTFRFEGSNGENRAFHRVLGLQLAVLSPKGKLLGAPGSFVLLDQ